VKGGESDRFIENSEESFLSGTSARGIKLYKGQASKGELLIK